MSETTYHLLVINVGSTSIKLGYYENESLTASTTVRYDPAYIESFPDIYAQEEMREEGIRAFLDENGIDPHGLDAVVTRGAIVKPVPSGCIEVTDALVADARKYGSHHVTALGVKLALDFARSVGIPCYTVDPTTVDEMTDVSRITGFPEIEREVQYQPLNQKAVAKKWCRDTGRSYSDVNVIVAHMGGGTTIGAHDHGKIVDVNNGCFGEGTMSPERPGGVPLVPVIRECYSGEYTLDEMEQRVFHDGGVKAYLGTTDMREIERRVNEGDVSARLILEAYGYQVSKDIGGLAAVLKGKVDAILLTGGVAYCKTLTDYIEEHVSGLADTFALYPGEDELNALVNGTLAYLRGEEPLIDYDIQPELTSTWESTLERERARRAALGEG